jgi:hypothetical protein
VYHSREGKSANHTTAECYSLKEIKKARRAKGSGAADPAQEQNSDLGFGHDAGALHMFTGVDN